MRWHVLLLAAAAATARADTPPALSETVIAALTSVDTLASSSDFELIFNGSGAAVTSLAAIAQNPAADIGVQLRAIRGLAEFPASGTVPHDTLAAIVTAHTGAHTGAQVLILRAAIEALGALAIAGAATPGDAALLVDHLNDASRDVRATTARALGDLCDASAITPLRIRFQTEGVDQVKLAISEALRVLGTCGST